MLAASADTVRAEPDFSAMETLPPGEQYHRLGLMLLAGAGARPPLRDALGNSGADVDTDAAAASFDPDDYTTPLARIVGEAKLLDGAAALFRFTGGHADAIGARMDELAAGNPVLISMLDDQDLREDAILVRSAIADAIAGSGVAVDGPVANALAAYRVHTVYLRNEMEFDGFSSDLERLTDEAIASVGGQTEAYQRMFDDETAFETFDQHIESAESIYTLEPIDMKRAGELADELMEDVILMEGQPTDDP